MTEQIINDLNGKPIAIVISYDQYLILKRSRDIEETEIPRAVIELVRECKFSPIRAWRIYLNISQKELAETLQMHIKALAECEHRYTKNSQNTLDRIAAAFGISVHQLIL